MPHLRRPLAAFLGLLALSAGSVLAQAPAGEDSFGEAIRVNVVNLDVFVSDRQGKPVVGLKAEDFAVTEDGKPVKITNFYTERREPAAAAGGKAAAERPPDQRLRLVVFLDDVLLARPQQPRRRRTLLSGKPPRAVSAAGQQLSFGGELQSPAKPGTWYRGYLLAGDRGKVLGKLPFYYVPGSGGQLVEPGRYGQEPHPKLTNTDPHRDAFELELVERAIDRELPILGMCRGIQMLNVALGGTLVQDVSLVEDGFACASF